MSNSGPYRQIGSDAKARLSTAGAVILSAAAAPCCCSGSSPADPCANPATSLAITGYFDGFFTPCTDCTNAIASDCVWDGTFLLVNTTPCGYSNYPCFNGTLYNGQNCYDCQMSGKRMCQLDPPGPSQITYDPTSGIFTLQITCQNATGGEIIWQGQQSGGSFTGTYQRIGGCDTHATIEIS